MCANTERERVKGGVCELGERERERAINFVRKEKEREGGEKVCAN